jgi:hypothetical protein
MKVAIAVGRTYGQASVALTTHTVVNATVTAAETRVTH